MASSEARRKEYWARINRAVDYIENHLGQEMTLADIAAAAYFSPFHFHRIFRSLMGEPVNAFVQRVRLERAALLLRANPDTPVTRVAMECGYVNPAAFSRAFRSAFGCTPSEWRRGLGETGKDRIAQGKEGKEGAPSARYPSEAEGIDPESRARRKKMAEELRMDVRVEELPAQTVAYIRHVGPYQGDSELFRGLFGRLFQWRAPETSSGSGGSYAQARFELNPEDYAAAWGAVFGDWLPESGYQPDDRIVFERYLNNPGEHPQGKHIVEICIPVKPL